VAPTISSDVLVGPDNPWGPETEAILDSENLFTITIRDVILDPFQLRKLGELKLDYPLQTLILSNIFGAQTIGSINIVLGKLSQSFIAIREIDISNNALGPSVYIIINLLKSASSINLSNTGLSIEDFNGVSNHFSVDLKTLSCCRNYFQGCPSIEHLHKIENLNFSSCRIPRNDLNKLISTISRLPSVRKLNLSDNGNSIEDDVIVNLCTKLAVWSDIEEFSLADIGLTAIQSRWILNTLKSGSYFKLQHIDMSFCRLRKIQVLGDYFLSLPALKFLNLTGNKLTEERIIEITRKLPNCTVINEVFE